jgi:integrase/recombinase XerD
VTEPSALVHAPQDETWKRIKSLVLDGLPSRHSKRAYEQALDAFERWCVQTGGPGGHPGFTKATVQAYRTALESASLAASSINVRLSAVKKLAVEAADNGLLAPEVAAAITRVKGAKRHGVRAGNWLTLDQAERLLDMPGRRTNKGRRDRALLALLVGCGLRRQELAGLRIEDIQQRDGRWCGPGRQGKPRTHRSHAPVEQSRHRRLAGRGPLHWRSGARRRQQGGPDHGAGHERAVDL